MLRCITGGWHQCDWNWHHDWRHEPDSKLYVVHSGVAWYDCGAGEQPLRAGRIYLIPGERRHRFRCPRRMHLWWLHLRPEDPRLIAQIAGLTRMVDWPQAGREPTWQRLTGYGTERPWPTTLAMTGLVLDLCALLPPPPPRDPQRLEAVASWLTTAALRNPPLDEIARQAALSPSQLTRLAHREWGETPHARVLRLRLDYGRALLAQSDLTVAAIARRCGFADAPTFSKSFRAWQGEPPDAYRRGLEP
jgi:AraC-like DNA-binding protein